MLKKSELDALRHIAKGVAAQFGSNCEVVVHEISEHSTQRSICAIENGHISGRKLGDGPSQVVLEQLSKADGNPEDHLCYLTRTPDGKLLKSSSVYIHKVREIRFLNEHGALLITKSGDKIASHFGISKYTLYSYLDVKTGGKSND